MKIYTITGGVNGVGKSSLSGVLSAESTDLGIIIDTDKLIAELEGDRIKGGKLAIDLHPEATLSGIRTLKTMKQPQMFYRICL